MTSVTCPAQRCPSDYEEVSGRCLLVVTTDRRWTEAQSHCSGTGGGRLATVTTSNDAVVAAVSQLSPAPRRVWIGLRKTRTEWQYATGRLCATAHLI